MNPITTLPDEGGSTVVEVSNSRKTTGNRVRFP
jgi:hypothetical protein